MFFPTNPQIWISSILHLIFPYDAHRSNVTHQCLVTLHNANDVLYALTDCNINVQQSLSASNHDSLRKDFYSLFYENELKEM